MAASRRLTHDDRVKIVVLREEGYSLAEIAARVRCSKSGVSKTLSRVRVTGSVNDRKRSGRPRITSPRDDRALVKMSLQNRRLTSTELKRKLKDSLEVECSSRTVRRRLDNAGLHGRVARKKPLLTSRHRAIRLKWAKERKDWTPSDWNKIVWSDESKYNLFGSDGRVYIRRRVGEELLSECTQQTVKFGGGSVMVWGCMSCDGVGPLVKVEGRMSGRDYIRLLSQTLVPYIQSLGPEYIFQDDNAPCHRAHTVTRWVASKGVKTMEVWPPQSPDLNPIEHLWRILAIRIKSYKPKNLKELEERLKEEWSKIPAVEVQNLIASMPKRVAAVITAKGGPTKY